MAFVDAVTRGYEVHLDGSHRYVTLVDTTGIVVMPGANERKVLAKWMNDPHVMTRQTRLCVGASTVVSNAAMRGVLTALYWLWTPPVPQHAAADLDGAIDWALRRMASEHVPLGVTEGVVRAYVYGRGRERERAEVS